MEEKIILQLIRYLKENLKIETEEIHPGDFGSTSPYIAVKIVLDGVVISEDYIDK